jgi:hypothetical protein
MSASQDPWAVARETIRRLTRKREILKGHVRHLKTLHANAESKFQQTWYEQPIYWKVSAEGRQYKTAARDDIRRYSIDMNILKRQIVAISRELKYLDHIVSSSS